MYRACWPAAISKRAALSGMRDGRFAALTNYRAPFDIRGAPTRGLCPTSSAARPSRRSTTRAARECGRLQRLQPARRRLATARVVLQSRARGRKSPHPSRSRPACIVVARLDTLPKVVRKRGAGTLLTDNPTPSLDELIALMRDPHVADDDALPHRHSDRTRACAVGCVHRDRIRYAQHDRARHDEGRRAADGRDQERCDDDGSHRTVRPGTFERAFTFDLDADAAALSTRAAPRYGARALDVRHTPASTNGSPTAAKPCRR